MNIDHERSRELNVKISKFRQHHDVEDFTDEQIEKILEDLEREREEAERRKRPN